MNIMEIEKEEVVEVVGLFMFSEEEKKDFSRIIKEFNDLYYKLGMQTWGITQWRGINVMKPPTDLWVYQELINEIKPDLIIETGTCYGGSALFMRDVLDKVNPKGWIITIDIMPERLKDLVKDTPGILVHVGSSVKESTISFVKDIIEWYSCKKIMVILDSDHSPDHVKKEMELYAPLVSKGSILIVEDVSNCPLLKPVVDEFLIQHSEFRRNYACEKFMLTFSRDGFLERCE